MQRKRKKKEQIQLISEKKEVKSTDPMNTKREKISMRRYFMWKKQNDVKKKVIVKRILEKKNNF